MKIRPTFYVSVLLMVAVLVFNAPLATFAQQNAEVPTAKTTIAPDQLQTIMVTAKADAEKDVNEVAWVVSSCLGFMVGGIGGGMIFFSTAIYAVEQTELSCAGEPAFNPIPYILVGGSGIALGCFLPSAYARWNTPSPPPDRLLGKSPEYVQAYTFAYVKSAKRRRNVSILGTYGALTLVGLVGGALSN